MLALRSSARGNEGSVFGVEALIIFLFGSTIRLVFCSVVVCTGGNVKDCCFIGEGGFIVGFGAVVGGGAVGVDAVVVLGGGGTGFVGGGGAGSVGGRAVFIGGVVVVGGGGAVVVGGEALVVVGGGLVVGGGCSVGCFVGTGSAAGFLLTARAGRSVGWSSRKVSSTFTCFIPDKRVQIVIPLNWNYFKAVTKVAGSS